jgi:small subunit ribosomal protein S9
MEEEKKKSPDKVKKQPLFYQAVGRRKTATARVRLYPVIKNKITVGTLSLGAGEMIVNNKPINMYFPGEIARKIYQMPLAAVDSLNRFAATIKVEGSGLSGQLQAVVHGIARALLIIDKENYQKKLKALSLLTRDSRAKERRKAGLAHKARARKQSPKR